MRRREAAVLALRLEIELQRRRTVGAGGGGGERERFRFSYAVRGGAACFASTPLGGFSPRALGFGLLAPPTERRLEAIRRYYAALGLPTRLVVYEGAVPSAALRLLERTGFTREADVGAGWVREVARRPCPVFPVGAAPVPPLGHAGGPTVEQLRPAAASSFARLVRAGFAQRGRWRFFARANARLVAAHPRTTVAFVAWLDGRPAGSGGLFLHRRAGLLFSGSVLEAFRGRGVQPALIAARITAGFDRGARAFFVQTGLDNASARNVADAGFRRHSVLAVWAKGD